MFYQNYKGPLEALLFASGNPLPLIKLAEILEIPQEHIQILLDEIQLDLAATTRGLTIVQVAGGYQLCTKAEHVGIVEKLAKMQDSRLSAAAMETLAIIAFKQPITRQEIEVIRGVKVDRVVTTLVDRRLIREVGRKEALGRPILYGTTEDFLKCFGLNSLNNLPSLAEYVQVEQP